MLPLLLLAVAAPPPPIPENPVVEGAVLSPDAQWAALAASPRILMQSGSFGTATGITIAVKDEFAYILTARHAIPDVATDREVQFFTRESYPKPAQAFRAVEMLAQWGDPDLALLRAKVGSDAEDIPTLRLARPGERPVKFPFGAVSIGCSDRGPPSSRSELVVAKRYARRPGDTLAFFWELANPPVQGRSGGPLLDSEGRVIGVCAAAQRNKGYYTHLDEILAGLKKEGYGWLWQRAN